MEEPPLIRFRLDRRSGLPVYRQLIDQVRDAIGLGILRPGDQLPTVRDVVGQVAVNPNTVHRAYRELELLGFVEGVTGRGTFVRAAGPTLPGQHAALARRLEAWVRAARDAGLDDEAIRALVAHTIRTTDHEGER